MPIAHSGGQLRMDDVALTRIADAVGTPTYVYSWPDIRARYRQVEKALAGIRHRVCYAVKANGNLSVLARIASLGGGFDVVSGGELERVLRAGGAAARVVFSGGGKSAGEIGFAVKCGIDCCNVDGEGELERVAAQAQLLGRRARVAIRVNPRVDADTHPYVATGVAESKFGVSAEAAFELLRRAARSPHLEAAGVACHIGSQIGDVEPYRAALDALLALVDRLEEHGVRLRQLDIGGGFSVPYQGEAPFDLAALSGMLRTRLAGRNLTLIVEPGRFLVAEAGVLLTRVEYLKPADAGAERNYAVVDAAMNDLLRPALYQAWHGVEPVEAAAAAPRRWTVVGPVCESGDFLAEDRELALAEGSLLAIRGCGAYGFVQSSNYNGRPRAAEVLVEGDRFHVVRKREAVADLMRLERIVA